MARKSTIASLFGRSPVKPLQQHIGVVNQCAGLILDLFEAVCDEDAGKTEKIVNQIFKLESEADQLKNELRAHLPKSLMMPVDRRDLLEILDLQDSIADTAEDIAGLVSLRKMEIPESLQKPLLTLVRRCIDACNHAARIINELDELVATGFRGRESDAVQDMVEELNMIESDTDEMAIDLVRALFALEDEMKPVSVMLWYDLIQLIGELADYAEKVGNRLRLLLAR